MIADSGMPGDAGLSMTYMREPETTTVMQDITLARSGDGAAYARVIERYQAYVAKLLRRVADDQQSLEELVHDVFVDAYLSLASFRGEHGEASFMRWLSQLAARRGYRHLKQRQKSRKYVELTDIPAEETAAPAEEVSLECVLKQLPPRDRMVVAMLYLEEKSVAECTELLGWSQTMVKVQAFRARGKLKKIMLAQEAATQKRGNAHE